MRTIEMKFCSIPAKVAGASEKPRHSLQSKEEDEEEENQTEVIY